VLDPPLVPRFARFVVAVCFRFASASALVVAVVVRSVCPILPRSLVLLKITVRNLIRLISIQIKAWHDSFDKCCGCHVTLIAKLAPISLLIL